MRTASNQVIDLVPVASSQQATGAFSLASLQGGVYTLDVITQKGTAKAAYEGVLSIGNQPVTVIGETTKRVTNEYGDLLIFLPPEECPKGYAFDNNGRCLPICDETELPDGGECIDEGDPDDCEPGFVDRGNGCEPEEGGEPPICTPDGPPCPPCPQGVEAGWCADDDELDDIDECLIRDCPDGEGIDQDFEETESADADEDISPEFSGNENDTPEPPDEEESDTEETSSEEESESPA